MATTDAEKRRRDQEALLFGLLNLLARDTNHHLRELVQGYLDVRTSLTTLSQSLVAALQDSHGHASYLGRRLAGKHQPFGHADNMAGLSVAIGQQKYLSGLLTDLATGRYTGGQPSTSVGRETISPALWTRIAMYAKMLRSTAEQSWALNLPHGTMINWVLGAPEEHCSGCPDLAAGGPYPASAMPTYPGAGDTPCLSSCFCSLEIAGGGRSFPPLEL